MTTEPLVNSVRERLALKHEQECGRVLEELAARPKGKYDVYNRLLAFEQVRRLGLNGFKEGVVFAHLHGTPRYVVARDFQCSQRTVKQIINEVTRHVEKLNRETGNEYDVLTGML